jgi:hypothetical protein
MPAWHLLGGTEKNQHNNSKWAVSRLRFDPLRLEYESAEIPTLQGWSVTAFRLLVYFNEDLSGVLSCGTYVMYTSENQPMFRRNILSPFSRSMNKPSKKPAWSDSMRNLLCLLATYTLPASHWFLTWLILRRSKWRRHVPPKRWLILNRVRGIISQKTELF